MRAAGCRQMFALPIVQPRLARTVAEPLAVALTNEEINGVPCARVTVSDVVLAKDSRRLHEQVARPRPLCGFAQLLCAD